jgi:ribosomal protein S15P/S13E
MNTNLNFENDETKKLLCKFDFGFFLKQNFEEKNYSQKDIEIIYKLFKTTTEHIKGKAKDNTEQFNLYCESQVRKMYTGGLLPSTFGLDEGRGYVISDFKEIGENWAYFNHWQKYYKRKVTMNKVWDIVIRTGSILAIVLTMLKLIETFQTDK